MGATWERGMWDPGARNLEQQWWENRAEQSQFVNSLRDVLGLDPLPTWQKATCAARATSPEAGTL